MISSLLELIVVSPFCACSENASVCHGVGGIRFQLQELVCGLEQTLVISTTITNNDLGWILIGHDNGWLGEARAEGLWVVGLQRFLMHTSMQVVSWLVDGPKKINNFYDLLWPGLSLGAALNVAVSVGVLPAGFFKRECNSYGTAVLHHDVWACLDAGCTEERSRFGHLLFHVWLAVMQSPLLQQILRLIWVQLIVVVACMGIALAIHFLVSKGFIRK